MELRKAFRFRIYPNKSQEKFFLQMAGARRFVWNWALNKRIEFYKENKKSLSFLQISKDLTELKKQPETAWLKEMSASSLQQALRDLEKAFKNFFEKRAGFPKWDCKKSGRVRFRIPAGVSIRGNKLFVPKVGLVKVRVHRIVDGIIKSATFKKDTCNHWYVTLVSEFQMPDVALPPPEEIVGIDAGIKESKENKKDIEIENFAVLSNGETISIPKFYKRGQKRLRKAQKSFCRCKKESKRRIKAKSKVAKIHKKIANQRKEFLHYHSYSLAKRFDAICLEDLNLKGLAKSKLAKSFTDASHGEFRWKLEYKCLWNRKHFVKIDRWFPSSKTCRNCGKINDNLTLGDRWWRCEGCNTLLDRDLNAAGNIEDEGRKILAGMHSDKRNARRGKVRPPDREAHSDETRIDLCSNFSERVVQNGSEIGLETMGSRKGEPNSSPDKDLEGRG